MTSLVFPDINVWLALSTSVHVHYERAQRWFGALDDEEIVFCRHTQLGLLRLLTTTAVMGKEVLTQRQAWQVYDSFLRDRGASFLHEPKAIEAQFRSLTRLSSASHKDWTDSYLAAFAIETGAALITFDKALAGRVKGSILL